MSKDRTLREIAREIRTDWGVKVHPHAEPYLAAMATLTYVTDPYFQDSGKSIVLYFLSNASTWRGDTARRVKAELKGMVG